MNSKVDIAAVAAATGKTEEQVARALENGGGAETLFGDSTSAVKAAIQAQRDEESRPDRKHPGTIAPGRAIQAAHQGMSLPHMAARSTDAPHANTVDTVARIVAVSRALAPRLEDLVGEGESIVAFDRYSPVSVFGAMVEVMAVLMGIREPRGIAMVSAAVALRFFEEHGGGYTISLSGGAPKARGSKGPKGGGA